MPSMSAPDSWPRCGIAGISSSATFDPSFLADDALRQERLARAYRSAQQVPHGQRVARPPLQQCRIVSQPLLRGLVADHRVECPARLDELQQAPALPFEKAFLERAEHHT